MKKPDGGPAFPARRDGVINDERLAEFNALVEYGGDGSVAAYVSGLVAQRDELLDACRRLLKFNEELCTDLGVSTHYPSADVARKVIAQVEGR